MKEQLTIVKVGGKIVENEQALAQLVHDFSAIEGHKILVHGGGRTATDIAGHLGIPTQMVNGRRVTDADMLQVVTMVYGGLVNKRVVAQLQACGVCALGMTGADMDVIRSHQRIANGIDYGYVGDVDRVDGHRLAALLRSGLVPVLAPLTHDGRGNLLNTNADTIACETAQALAPHFEVTLTYCFEHAGVLRQPDDPESVIPHIHREMFTQLVADGTVSGGMIPKLENCLSAVEKGVNRVFITQATDLKNVHGTTIQ